MSGMAAGIDANVASGIRRPPTLSAVMREEFGMVGARVAQGRPMITVASTVLIMLYFGSDPNLWRIAPFFVGFTYGMGIWGNRVIGRSGGWELPVDRVKSNMIRSMAGLSWTLATVAVLVPISFLRLGDVFRVQPAAATLTAFGSAALGFSILAAFYQSIAPQRKYLFGLGLLVFMPFALLPTRALLAILPSPLEPVISGRFGLNLFSGKFLFEQVRPGMVPTLWNLGNWLIAAAIWISISLGLLLLVSFRHQE